MSDPGVIGVRGNPTADDLAALMAALAERPSTVDDPYERWRRGRLTALKHASPDGLAGSGHSDT
jgi:hypothetical protein